MILKMSVELWPETRPVVGGPSWFEQMYPYYKGPMRWPSLEGVVTAYLSAKTHPKGKTAGRMTQNTSANNTDVTRFTILVITSRLYGFSTA
jgi:hypothetical protein